MKIFFGFLLATVLWAVILSFVPVSDVRVYDCGMAEWHPDIPKDVKEECRRRSLEHWNEEQRRKII